MIDWLKKYIPYLTITGVGLMLMYRGDYGIGAGIALAGNAGYYYGIDKKILKH